MSPAKKILPAPGREKIVLDIFFHRTGTGNLPVDEKGEKIGLWRFDCSATRTDLVNYQSFGNPSDRLARGIVQHIWQATS